MIPALDSKNNFTGNYLTKPESLLQNLKNHLLLQYNDSNLSPGINYTEVFTTNDITHALFTFHDIISSNKQVSQFTTTTTNKHGVYSITLGIKGT